ncbi:MAG: 4-(cytidine 5'-diphospho)-2-C-methyl-D-erythritol kinase [Planctomycetota bacterium]
MQLKTPAKINLSLAIRGRRPDGFHEIESWITPIALYDTLTFAESSNWQLAIRPAHPTVAADETNLIAKAAHALATEAGRSCHAHVTLDKCIPVGAGLGGGSSDAAATLLALNTLWNLNWPIARLTTIAAALGSDVRLFLDPRPVIVRGRGEILDLLPSSWQGWIALIIPSFALSTVDVYRRHSRLSQPIHGDHKPWLASSRPADELAPHLFNDLEPAAFDLEPRLRTLHADLNTIDGRPVRMTGSGSCLFTIFDAKSDAERWAEKSRTRLDIGDRIDIIESL